MDDGDDGFILNVISEAGDVKQREQKRGKRGGKRMSPADAYLQNANEVQG
jgi:hypothetical protein